MQRLILRIENKEALSLGAQPSFTMERDEASIGRKPGNDWVLPDTTRFISGRHLTISRGPAGYAITDRSTNGTFLNGQAARLEGAHVLNSGDRLKIGSYILVAELEAVVEPSPDAAPVEPVETVEANSSVEPEPAAEPTPEPVAAPEPPPTDTAPAEPVAEETAAPDAGLDIFDDLLGDAPLSGPEGSDAGEAQEPLFLDAAPMSLPPHLRPPSETTNTERTSAGRTQAPNYAEMARRAKTQTGVGRPNTAQPAPEEVVSQPPQPATPEPSSPGPFAATPAAPTPAEPTPPAQPAPQKNDPFAGSDGFAHVSDFGDLPGPAEPAEPAPSDTDIDATRLQPRPASPAPAPAPAQQRQPAPTPPAPAQTAPAAAAKPDADSAFLRGFLIGAGIPEDAEIGLNPEDMGKAAGEALRVAIDVIRALVDDRAAARYEVSEDDRTLLTAVGNNPLKSKKTPEEIFAALFLNPKPGFLSGADGFDNALSDIRRHQVAILAAIQPALIDIIEGLSPEEIAREDGGGSKLLGGGAAKRHWEEVERRWKERTAETADAGSQFLALQDAFTVAFAKHYTAALKKI